MLDLERFLERCRMTVTGTDPEKAMQELVSEAVADQAAVASALSVPEHGGFEVLHRAPDLTVLNFAWPPWMCLKPHNHCMWSVVGIFSGREDNIFWRRVGEPGVDRAIEAAGARTLGVGDVTLLGRDIIHSVVNPIGKLTRAIHVYGGDFFAPPIARSEWDPESLQEKPWDVGETQRLFSEADARSRSSR